MTPTNPYCNNYYSYLLRHTFLTHLMISSRWKFLYSQSRFLEKIPTVLIVFACARDDPSCCLSNHDRHNHIVSYQSVEHRIPVPILAVITSASDLTGPIYPRSNYWGSYVQIRVTFGLAAYTASVRPRWNPPPTPDTARKLNHCITSKQWTRNINY